MAGMATDLPRALRVVCLRDRLVLTDVSRHLRGSSPWSRNALIDAANLAARDESPGRHLVLPFTRAGQAPEPAREVVGEAPHSASEQAAPADAAAGFLGILRLGGAAYAVLATQVRAAGALPGGQVMCVQRVRLVRLAAGLVERRDRDFADAVAKLLQAGALYYALDTDITRLSHATAASVSGLRSGNAFWWTWPLARLAGPNATHWVLRTIYGFVGTQTMRFAIGAPLATSSARPGRPGMSSLPDTSGVGHDFNITLVSRRSRRRAGTRYITRGVDALGDVANFVETEQVVWPRDAPEASTAFVVIRGSVPVFWRQDNGIARPSPELDAPLASSRAAFSTHFRNLVRSYSGVTAVSLVDMNGSEGVLAEAFERHFELDVVNAFDGRVAPKLVSFDFHSHCSGKEYDRGLATLMTRLRPDLDHFGFSSVGVDAPGIPRDQRGVFRVNCVDCLDRTNVVQSMLARAALNAQLRALFHSEVTAALSTTASDPSSAGARNEWSSIRLYRESEDRFKQIWGDNADAVSKQYSGTGALKTDFTRTGKRSTTGIVGDGVKSVVRMYYKNFVDEGRQEAIDILCGSANVRDVMWGGVTNSGAGSSLGTLADARSESFDGLSEPTLVETDSTPASSATGQTSVVMPHDARVGSTATSGGASDVETSALWYSFRALRMNAGGDKQDVGVELRDDAMQIVTPEGVSFEYPRGGLASWDTREDVKASERKQVARLRLIHDPSPGAPAATSPLDLIFRLGPTSRENFLRAYLSWAKPPVLETIGGPVRVRVLSSRGVSKHRMRDWGLNMSDSNVKGPLAKCEGREVVALVVPEGHSDTREWGLAAVPLDVDDSSYVLVSARAVSSRGPAIAVLASKQAAPSVMCISEATIGRAGSLTGGGAAGVSLMVSGTSVCFVSARLGGAKDLFRILYSLRLKRSTFDVTNQFEHFYISGILGDLQWRDGDVPDDGPEARQFLTLGDGAKAYSLGSGLSVLRNSFPTTKVVDLLDKSTFWSQRGVQSNDETSHERSATPPEAAAKEFGLPGAAAPFPGTAAYAAMNGSQSRSSAAEGLGLCIGMIDEVVGGLPPPLLPDVLTRCTITLSDLRGEGIRMPPGVDQATPLNTYVAVYSDFAGAEPVVTRPTQRPVDHPEWREVLRLSLAPSDVESVKRSFLFAQVLIPAPLADPIPAGHCVIPVAFAADGRSEFDVPLRLAGISCGRLRGIVELEVGSVVDEREAGLVEVSDSGLPSSGPRERNGLTIPGGGSIGMRGESSFGGVSRDPLSLARASASALSTPRAAYSGSTGSGLGPSLQGAPSLDEMNEKLEAARRKGSKQIKSMVGKLSSFLGQGGSSTSQFDRGAIVGSGPAVGAPSDRSESALDKGSSGLAGNAGIVAGVGQAQNAQGRSRGSGLDLGNAPRQREALNKPLGDSGQWAQPAVLPAAPSPRASHANSRSSAERHEDPLLLGLTGSPRTTTCATQGGGGNVERGSTSDDALLRSLSRGRSHSVDKSAIAGEDDLLAGLRAASVSSAPPRAPDARSSADPQNGTSSTRKVPHAADTDDWDDGWGNFEEASVAPTGATASGASSRTSRARASPGGNLIDL